MSIQCALFVGGKPTSRRLIVKVASPIQEKIKAEVIQKSKSGQKTRTNARHNKFDRPT